MSRGLTGLKGVPLKRHCMVWVSQHLSVCFHYPGPTGGLGHSGSQQGQGKWDPLSKDAQRQLRESYGRLRRQWGLGGKPQTFPEIRCPSPQLPEGHPTLPEWAAASSSSTQVSPTAQKSFIRLWPRSSCFLSYHRHLCTLLLEIHSNEIGIEGHLLLNLREEGFFSHPQR